MGARDLGTLLLLPALWGASFIFIRVAVPTLGPFVLVELRAVVAAVWMGDALTMRKVAGVVLGVLGVTVLVGWDPIAMNWAVVLSVGAMLAASLSYALGAVYAKRTFTGATPMTIAIGQLTVASMLILPLAGVSLPDERPTAVETLSVLALALLSTAVAYMLYFRLIENVGPTSTSTVTLLVPLFGLLFGVLILDEPVGLGTLAGLVLILSSVTLITGLGFSGAKIKTRV